MSKKRRTKKIRGSPVKLSGSHKPLLQPREAGNPADVIRVCRLKGDYFHEGKVLNNAFQCYVFYLDRKAVRGKNGDWVKADQKCISNEWHRTAPEDCHLKPGEGPIRVKLVRDK